MRILHVSVSEIPLEPESGIFWIVDHVLYTIYVISDTLYHIDSIPH